MKSDGFIANVLRARLMATPAGDSALAPGVPTVCGFCNAPACPAPRFDSKAWNDADTVLAGLSDVEEFTSDGFERSESPRQAPGLAELRATVQQRPPGITTSFTHQQACLLLAASRRRGHDGVVGGAAAAFRAKGFPVTHGNYSNVGVNRKAVDFVVWPAAVRVPDVPGPWGSVALMFQW